MARALFVRPRIFARFVWGRTKRHVARLEIQLSRIWTNFLTGNPSRSISQDLSAYRLGMAGQLTALCCFLSTLNDHAPGVTSALASDAAGQLSAGAASPGGGDLTSILGIMALLLLMASNAHLLRRRHLAAAFNGDNPLALATDPAVHKVHAKPDFPSQSANGPSPCFELERQCQKLADIADRSQHARTRVEAVNRARNARLASISHELRTPLNAVIGFSDLMRRELFGPLGHSKYQEYAEHIGDSGHDLLSAVDDIFVLTSEDLDRMPGDDTEVVEDSEETMLASPACRAGLVTVSLRGEVEEVD